MAHPQNKSIDASFTHICIKLLLWVEENRGLDRDPKDVAVTGCRSCPGCQFPWVDRVTIGRRHLLLRRPFLRDIPCGAWQIPHLAESVCVTAVVSPFKGSAWQPAHILSLISWVSTSLPFHRNIQNTGELFSPPADFSILLFLSGLLPGAPQQDCGKLPRNLFNWLPTRWSQRHMQGSLLCSSMSLASGTTLRGFTVSPEGSQNV